jgi:hypothetical protein
MRTVPLNLIACSVPVGVTDYSPYTLEDICITPPALFHLADFSYSSPLFLYMLYVVRPF